MLKKILAFLFLSIFSFSSLAANLQNPYQKTQFYADKVFGEMNSQLAAIKKNPQLLITIVKRDLLPEIHVKYAAALVIGDYYQKLTPEQRNQFFDTFENYLIHMLAKTLAMYDGQKYEIEKAKSIGDKQYISVRVSLLPDDKKEQPIRLDFQWRKNSKTGEWQCYDLIAEGISMISTKQSEWGNTLRNGGIEALIKQLKEQTT